MDQLPFLLEFAEANTGDEGGLVREAGGANAQRVGGALVALEVIAKLGVRLEGETTYLEVGLHRHAEDREVVRRVLAEGLRFAQNWFT